MYHVTVTTWEEICLNDVMISINKMFNFVHISRLWFMPKSISLLKRPIPCGEVSITNFPTTMKPYLRVFG